MLSAPACGHRRGVLDAHSGKPIKHQVLHVDTQLTHHHWPWGHQSGRYASAPNVPLAQGGVDATGSPLHYPGICVSSRAIRENRPET